MKYQKPINMLPKIYISDALLKRTAAIIASYAEDVPSEGLVYWFGIDVGGQSVITTLMVPDAHSSWGCISTTPEANAEVIMAVEAPLVLIGQAHSHPGSDIRHSDIDDRQTFPRFHGAISIVVPYFAKKKLDLGQCGIHRFVDGKYIFIQPRNVKDHLIVIPGERDFRKVGSTRKKR
jgi:hypothetical protein